MELIKLNDQLSILINQDNCSAAEARITSQTAVYLCKRQRCFDQTEHISKIYHWCAKSHCIKIIRLSESQLLLGARFDWKSLFLSLFWWKQSCCYSQPFIGNFFNDLLNFLVSVCWHVQSSRHFTCSKHTSILTKTPSEKFVCLHSLGWLRNLMQKQSYIAGQFVLVN